MRSLHDVRYSGGRRSACCAITYSRSMVAFSWEDKVPKLETIYSVFVASPANLSPERARLEDVIRELNNTWSQHLGIRLDLIRWETHAYPGFGRDAQGVINSQIGETYDIFIGLMWHHFGTP